MFKVLAHPTAMSVTLTAVLLIAGFPTPSVSETNDDNSYYFGFGAPTCRQWSGMTPDARLAWTAQFLSSLSMGHETSRRLGQQKYKESDGFGEVVEAVNKYCPTNPKALASEAVAPFLNP